ncbi:MAG: cupredoxin domain-containing protein [Burkholderiales bacterium]
MKNLKLTSLGCVLSLVLAAVAVPALASGDKAHAAHGTRHAGPAQKDWGIAGKAKASTRTVQVEIDKSLRFLPSSVSVKKGETLRFVVTNRSEVPHEFVLGTTAENQRHAEAMLKNPQMVHDEPHQASISPGNSKEVIWTFNRAGEFEFACMVPGHYVLGMKGKIAVAGVR